MSPVTVTNNRHKFVAVYLQLLTVNVSGSFKLPSDDKWSASFILLYVFLKSTFSTATNNKMFRQLTTRHTISKLLLLCTAVRSAVTSQYWQSVVLVTIFIIGHVWSISSKKLWSWFWMFCWWMDPNCNSAMKNILQRLSATRMVSWQMHAWRHVTEDTIFDETKAVCG